MNSVEKFNSLNGKKVSRNELRDISHLALAEKQSEVYNRIQYLFEDYPNAEYFKLSIATPAVFDSSVVSDEIFDNSQASKGLNAPKSKQSNTLKFKQGSFITYKGSGKQRLAVVTSVKPKGYLIIKEIRPNKDVVGEIPASIATLATAKKKPLQKYKSIIKSLKNDKDYISHEIFKATFNGKSQQVVNVYTKKRHVSNNNRFGLDTFSSEKGHGFVIPLEKATMPKALAASQHEGLAKDALSECGRLKPGYRYVKGGKIVKASSKAKYTKAQIIKHLSALSLNQFANHYAYSFSADLDKVKYRIEDKATHEKYILLLAEKVVNDDRYLSVIGIDKKRTSLSQPAYQFDPAALGIPYLSPIEEKDVLESSGKLAKPVSPEQIYSMITDMIINAIKENKDLFWRKTWQSEEYGIKATNYMSKKPYRGVNSLLLNFLAPLIRKKPINNPYWLTFKQIDKLKGKIVKGSKGHEVIYYSYIFKIEQEDPKISFSTNDIKKFNSFIKANESKINDTAKKSKIPILKYYKVFSADDVEGVIFKMPPIRKPKQHERIETAEAIIKNMPKKPTLNLEDKGDKAYYAPFRDAVTMPKLSFFEGPQEYYTTFFHELIHSTGHKTRLDRDLKGSFGTQSYAFEELIAELGAVFLCGESGILYHTLNNSAAYLKGWRERLLNKLEEDNKFIFKASSSAQQAVDFVLNRDKKGLPKYLKNNPKNTSFAVKETPEKILIEKIKKASNSGLKKYDFEDTKHVFKPGDMYRSDFDYKGMLLKSSKINNKTPLKTLEKIHNSLEDVNYHSVGKLVWDLILLKKKNEPQLALFGYVQTEILELPDTYKNKSVTELRDIAKLAYKSFVLKKVFNESEKLEIEFAKIGLKETLWHNQRKLDSRLILAITKLPEILKYAKLIKKSSPKPSHISKYKAIRILTFEGKIKIDNKVDYYVITVFETKNKNLKYFIEKASIKKSNTTRSSNLNKRSAVPNGLSKSKTTKNNNTTKKSLSKRKKLGTVLIDLVPTPTHADTENQMVAAAQLDNTAPIYKEPETTSEETQKEAEPAKPIKARAKNVLNSNDIMNLKFDALQFEGEWADFIDSPAKNMRIAIWGKPKNGKTAGATKFANMLCKYGNVLYNFADQGINKSTQDIWQMSGLVNQPNAHLTDTRELDELEKLCASGNYDFVFIDMINTYIHRTGIKYYEFEDRFLKKYPNISFILIFEVTKSGDFKGDQGWTHLPDALVTVDSFVMENQGRYGVGHYVIWKEGLEKTNPKKFNEYFDASASIPSSVML